MFYSWFLVSIFVSANEYANIRQCDVAKWLIYRVPKVVGSNPIFHPKSRRKVLDLAFFLLYALSVCKQPKAPPPKTRLLRSAFVCKRSIVVWVARINRYLFSKVSSLRLCRSSPCGKQRGQALSGATERERSSQSHLQSSDPLFLPSK